jgi:signal transduction histidine kinase
MRGRSTAQHVAVPLAPRAPTTVGGTDSRFGILEKPDGRPFVLAAALLLVLCGLIVLLADRPPIPRAVDALALNGVLATVATVLAARVGFMGILRWRLVGDVLALYVAVAVAVFGIGSLALWEVVPFVYADARNVRVLAALAAASELVIIGILAFGIRRRVAMRSVSPARMIAVTLTAISCLAVGLTFMPSTAQALAGVGSIPGGTSATLAFTFVAFAWTALAGVYTLNGLRAQRWLTTWFGLTIFGFTLAKLVGVHSRAPDDWWVSGAATLQIVALLFSLAAVVEELKRAYLIQQQRADDARGDAAAIRKQYRAEQAAHEERAHEARSALLAIQGAAWALENRYEHLDQAVRQSLARSLGIEIGRVQRLVEAEGRPRPCCPFGLRDVVSPLFDVYRAAGLEIGVELAQDLIAFGRPKDTVEILQCLLANAQRYAPGSPVRVEGGREHGQLIVRVRDHGPGIDRAHRETVFERSVTSGMGDGLGLHIARRLARDQGGDLAIEDVDAGASFVLTLPAALNEADTAPRAATPRNPLPLPRRTDGLPESTAKPHCSLSPRPADTQPLPSRQDLVDRPS